MFALGTVALAAMGQRLDVIDRIAAIGQRPEQRVGVVRVDIVIDRDADLAAIAFEAGRAVKRPPDLGARHGSVDRHDGDPQKPGELFMQRHF